MAENPTQHPKAEDSRQQVEPRPSAESKSTETRSEKSADDKRPGWVHWKIVASVFIGIGGFITVSLIVWQGAEWIRKSIDENVSAKLSDEKVIRQIAERVKPSIIFDANESIISDMGGRQFVKDIRVTERTDSKLPKRIVIDCTRHFASAPVMTALHDSVAIFTKPGRLDSWEFEISWIVSGIEHEDDDAKRLYRLEFIP